ncbi:MAG TPA: FecR domain-containing protein, partial [Terriglobales bacterium]|nr:FecR domain-containing protein [Terriglobales bacterium]
MNTSGHRVIGRSGDQGILSGSRTATVNAVLGRLALLALAIICFATLAKADDEDNSRSGGSQPDVARVSLIHGDVSMQRGDSEDWATATINTPLLRGDVVATGDKSRTEVQLDYANILRLSSSSQAKIADLTRNRIQIQLGSGYASYTQFKGSEADVEIDTPNVAVRPLRPGRYRVQVNSEFETDVIVRSGEVEISTPEGSTTVKEGHM